MAAKFVLSSFSSLLSTPASQIDSIGKSVPIPCFSEEDLINLNLEAVKHYKSASTLAEVEGDVVIVGDIHGNLHDLIRILVSFDWLMKKKFVFLGDYVDRGSYSLEVIALLLALAIEYPELFILIRGNHEFAGLNGAYGFRDQITEIYNSDLLWKSFNVVFSYMPLACLLNKTIFCVHGGISPHLTKASQVRKLARPITDFDSQLVIDLTWADPSEVTATFTSSKRQGRSNDFGNCALIMFLETNKYSKVIRGHQFIREGIRTGCNGHLITVFSSSGYEGMNQAGVLSVDMNNKVKKIFFDYQNNIKRRDAFITKVTQVEKDSRKIATLITCNNVGIRHKSNNMHSKSMISRNGLLLARWTTISPSPTRKVTSTSFSPLCTPKISESKSLLISLNQVVV